MNQQRDITELTSAEESHKGRRLLSLIFKTIIWGSLVDLFNSTFGVLWKYIQHVWLCLYYFWSPDIDRAPFNSFDFKSFCKHSFEAVVLTLIVIVFAVKVDWLPSSNEWLKEQLGNDIFQMEFQAGMYVAFAIMYLLSVIISASTGRAIRYWLTPNVTRKESDILMVTFFNSFLCITAVTALLLRIFVSFRDNELSLILSFTLIVLFLTCLLLTIIWALRFIRLNTVKGWRAVLFFLLSIIIYPLMFGIGGLITTTLLFFV